MPAISAWKCAGSPSPGPSRRRPRSGASSSMTSGRDGSFSILIATDRTANPRKDSLMKRALVLFSGGMDSTTALYWLRAEGFHVEALGVDYGQRHRAKELTAARVLASDIGVPFDVVNLTDFGRLLGVSSALTGDVAVPHGHYTDASMRMTVVPNRNMTMIALAVGVAVARQIPTVATAVHAGDHAIYPDCRPDFVVAM